MILTNFEYLLIIRASPPNVLPDWEGVRERGPPITVYLNRHHRSAIAVFAERGVLIAALLEVGAQLFENSVA